MYKPELLQSTYFYLSEPPKSADLWVKWGGEDVCAPDYFIERTTYPQHVIELVLHGQGVFNDYHTHSSLAAGSVYFFGPRVKHQYYTDPAHPMRKWFIVYGGRQAASLTEQTLGGLSGSFRVANVDDIAYLFRLVLEEGGRPTRFSQSICTAALSTLLYRLATTRLLAEPTNTPAYDTYQSARQYVEQHLDRLTTVGQWAAELGLTEAYMSRLFKRFDQQTPYHVLTRLRVNRIANLLLTTPDPIRHIAEQMGFSDQFVLSKVFRRAYGIAPQAYRNLNRPTDRS